MRRSHEQAIRGSSGSGPRCRGEARGVRRARRRDRPGIAPRRSSRCLRGSPCARAPLDVFLVRKLGAPGQEELAMGAIASGDVVVINDEVVQALKISPELVEAEVERERRELARREAIYRGGRPPLDVEGRTVILIDDGLATGSTMRAAVAALRRQEPARIVVAVPIGAASTCAELQEIADECICVMAPEHFRAVGLWYDDFAQTGDDQVCDLLTRAARAEGVTVSDASNPCKEAKPSGSNESPNATSRTRGGAAEVREVAIAAGERTVLGTLTLPLRRRWRRRLRARQRQRPVEPAQPVGRA